MIHVDIYETGCFLIKLFFIWCGVWIFETFTPGRMAIDSFDLYNTVCNLSCHNMMILGVRETILLWTEEVNGQNNFLYALSFTLVSIDRLFYRVCLYP